MTQASEPGNQNAQSEPERIAGLAALRSAVLELARNARRDLSIFSHELEPSLYDTAEFASAVSQVARSGRNARVRLLIREHDWLVKHGHHLVRLAQQLPSFVELRLIAPEYRHALQGFLVADAGGVFYQPQTDTYEAQTSPYSRRWARDLLTDFQRMWDHAQPDTELGRLPINS